MNFSAWSIRNPIAPILAFIILVALGVNSFFSLPITRFPNIDFPLISVMTAQQGAAPAEIETQVTKRIEDAVSGVTGAKNVISTVSDGMSMTVIEFRMEVTPDEALQGTKDAVDQILGQLPADVDAPVVTKIDVEGQAIMTFAVASAGKSIEELSWFIDDVIAREMQGRAGIGRISRYGGADREIRVELDPVRLDSFGIGAAGVSNQLRATNADLGAGRSEIGEREQAIRALGDVSTAENLAQSTIALPSGRHVRLGDLGEVIDTYQEPRSFARVDGVQVVVFAVYRAKGASEVTVAETVNASIDRIRAKHPDVTIAPVDDTVFYTYGNYESAIHTLLEGSLLAVIVVLLFLRNWRATLITAVALPLSAIPTFYLMDMLDFSLNLVSFLAITLATGILVDDAIVEIENIARHMRMGKTPYRAAIEAADEIGLAVIATSFTIIAVFVPVSFMPGIPGQYFRQFGLTVAIAVLFSLIVARLITPMMAAYLMRARDAAHADHDRPGLIGRGYIGLVRRTLAHPYLTLAAAVAILIVSLVFMAKVPGSFLPPEDVSRIQFSVELPPGTNLAETDAVTARMRAAIADVEGIDRIYVLGGSSPTGDLEVRRATMTLVLHRLDHSLLRRLAEIGQSIPYLGPYVPEVPTEGRLRPQNEIESEVIQRLATVPDARIYKLNDRGERDLSFSVLAADEASLNIAVARLEAALRGDPTLSSVSSSGALPRPEVQIVPREEEAARLGITTAQIAQTVRVATIGDFDAALAKVAVSDRLIPVRVQLRAGLAADMRRLGALKLTTASGASVPLNAVADIFVGEGPGAINRLNRERRATIGANLPPGVALGTASARFKEIADAVALPAGVRIAESGDAEIQQELMGSFGDAMILGLMLVLTVLILLFKSVIQPFTILFSLPLAIGGVAAALILTSSALSMPVMIGMLMLMGIVTKNAILLVDFAIEMQARGLGRIEAMIEAGRKRARPIVMTSIAMSAGMLPSALGVGEGGSFRAPMATAVIGGILVSTVLSLVIVPSFYLIMDDVSQVLGRLFSRIVGPKEDEPVAPDNFALAASLEASGRAVARLEGELHRLQDGRRGGGKLHVAE